MDPHTHTKGVLLFIFVETIRPLPGGPFPHSSINNNNRTWLSFVSLCSIIILILIIDSLRKPTQIQMPWTQIDPNAKWLQNKSHLWISASEFHSKSLIFYFPSGSWMAICSGDNTDENVHSKENLFGLFEDFQFRTLIYCYFVAWSFDQIWVEAYFFELKLIVFKFIRFQF